MSTHPAIVARLIEQMDGLADLLPAIDIETFADDAMHTSAERLAERIDDVLRSVEALRAERRVAQPHTT